MFFGKLSFSRAPKNPTNFLKIIDWPGPVNFRLFTRLKKGFYKFPEKNSPRRGDIMFFGKLIFSKAPKNVLRKFDYPRAVRGTLFEEGFPIFRI